MMNYGKYQIMNLNKKITQKIESDTEIPDPH